MARKHPLRNHPLRDTWRHMVARCTDERRSDYARYGGKGVTVCAEWRAPKTGMHAFVAHVGPRPTPQHSIDRIDNSRGYEPGNVRWVTRSEQMANCSRAVIIEFRGERGTAAAMGRRHGVCGMVVAQRLKKGWSVERALTHPVDQTRAHRRAS